MLMRHSSTQDAPRIFARDYYQRLFELEDAHWWEQGMREVAGALIAAHLPRGNSRRALDAGCGTGRTLLWLQRFASPADIVGIDLSPYALELCGNRQIRRVALASVLSLPFAEAAFDLVTAFDVIQHLPRPGGDQDAVCECARVLRPDGLLCVRTNVRPSGRRAGGAVADGNFYQYTRGEVAALVRDAGLRLITITYANMLPALVWSGLQRMIGQPRSTPGTYEGLSMQRPPAWLNALLVWVMRGEARYLAGGRRALPYGHSIVCLATKPAAAGGGQ